MAQETGSSEGVVLNFEQFWRWVQRHANCILRVSTPEVAIFDDEDLHWHFERGEGGLVFVQVIRGKRLLSEVAIQSGDVELVQSVPGEEDEVIFDLFLRGGDGEPAAYTFAMHHGYAEEEPASGSGGRWVH